MSFTTIASTTLIGFFVSSTIGIGSYFITQNNNHSGYDGRVKLFPSVQKSLRNSRTAKLNPMRCMSGPWNLCWESMVKKERRQYR